MGPCPQQEPVGKNGFTGVNWLSVYAWQSAVLLDAAMKTGVNRENLNRVGQDLVIFLKRLLTSQ